MKAYLDIVKDVLERGVPKHPYRVTEGKKLENTTIGLANVVFSHDMTLGFPLLTTRRMPIKSIAVELEGFIKGITSKKWYQDRKCKFWDGWANPLAVKKSLEEAQERNPGISVNDPYNVKIAKENEDDLGPIYGYQWRSFNKTYQGQNEDDGDFSNYTDQLKNVVDTLTNNPTDRRMVCSAWNPNQIHMAALPACHMIWNVVVYGDTINLWWGQRSCDLYLGVPCNIASYALLLTLLAKHSGLRPGNLTGLLADCHLYDNQLDVARELISREPSELPRLEIPNNDGEEFAFWKWDHTQMKLLGYSPQDKLSVGVVV